MRHFKSGVFALVCSCEKIVHLRSPKNILNTTEGMEKIILVNRRKTENLGV